MADGGPGNGALESGSIFDTASHVGCERQRSEQTWHAIFGPGRRCALPAAREICGIDVGLKPGGVVVAHRRNELLMVGKGG